MQIMNFAAAADDDNDDDNGLHLRHCLLCVCVCVNFLNKPFPLTFIFLVFFLSFLLVFLSFLLNICFRLVPFLSNVSSRSSSIKSSLTLRFLSYLLDSCP
jgi:hypothetical protein